MTKRILFVGYNLSDENLKNKSLVSGEVKNANYLREYLIKAGEDVTTLSISLYDDNSIINKGDIIRKGGGKGVFRWLQEARVLNKKLEQYKGDFDILYLTVPSYLPFLNKKKFKEIVVTAHGTYWPELLADLKYEANILKKMAHLINGYAQLLIDKLAFKMSDRLHSVSEYQVKEMIKSYGVPPNKIKVVRNGTDFSAKDIDIKYDYIWIGRLAKKKNINMFLRFAADNPDKKYCIVSGSDYFSIDENSVNHLQSYMEGNDSNVDRFHNVTDSELEFLLQKSKCLLVTSTGYESIPTVIFEALATGTFVIAPNSWGIREVEGEGLTKYIEGNYDSMLEAIVKLKPVSAKLHDVAKWKGRAEEFGEKLL